jgi:hypothetical protein
MAVFPASLPLFQELDLQPVSVTLKLRFIVTRMTAWQDSVVMNVDTTVCLLQAVVTGFKHIEVLIS